MRSKENLPENIRHQQEITTVDDASLSGMRSIEVQEILSKKAGFLERWSLIVYLAIIAMLFLTTWFIKSPDIVQATGILPPVNPELINVIHDTNYYAQINLPQSSFGKVALGQKVQLRLDVYPFEKFGYVAGKITYITKMPVDGYFLAIVQLTNGLNTNTKIKIKYIKGLTVKALILTKEERLLQRFYNSITTHAQP